MIDARATLERAAGIARGTTMIPPAADQPLWTVAVDIGGLDATGHRGLESDDYPLHLVGAAGLRPGDALLRGAGEAVERFALRPPAGPGQTFEAGQTVEAGQAEGRPLPFADPRVALGSPAADPTALRWMTGRDLVSGEPVAVPTALVDYPAADTASLRWFDPTPSGTAAGAGAEMALRNALHEIVERDAVMVAWAAQLRLERVELAGLVNATTTRPAAVRELGRLARVADELGLSVSFGAIPTALRGVECVVAVLVDRGSRRPLAAVGSRASTCRADAALGAFRETFQVREVLRGVCGWYPDERENPENPEHRGGRGPGDDLTASLPPVSCDLDRARLWTTPEAVDAVERWTESFLEGQRGRVPRESSDATAASVAELVEDLAQDGGRPTVVDLTDRLPAPIRAMGWHAVKVIPVGLHALRMDERHEFTWLRGRIDDAPDRLAVPGGVPDRTIHPFPHPLI
ncbi:ribosomal protein S12 methylthiotransferase accessory factor [Parafrankia irregularis]|uniref:Ribosomal protein S12 methylthiotransferase accessory factor n=1 Tax=Parafrankia irregularis TaxID=795642 RepID=A0A0S4QL01_9ACTN|nr:MULTISPECIES: YcaO-like family protein [Parafrankia]MBE3203933.1 YcaO-like family protein [Parafrankia sp. CH37]CUU55194.1 ribosomal protein S12 methylthiotransferase accessory factor [Parafrankia irregularis]